MPDLDLWQGSGGTRIEGIADDSRKVAPGDLFCAVPGQRHDGAEFAQQAVERGAVAILAQRSVAVDRPVTIMRTTDVRGALARIVSHVHRDSIDRLTYVGVTGTNGKTTTTLMTAAVLRAAGHRPAVLGTLGLVTADGQRTPGRNTTPGPLEVVETIQGLLQTGHSHLVCEVSSAGIMQHRIDFLPFSSCVFTNLSPEHMETHGTFDSYKKTKISWLMQANRVPASQRPARFANVVHLGDPAAAEFLKVATGPQIGFFLEQLETHVQGFVGTRIMGFDPRFSITSASMDVLYGRVRGRVHLKVGGRFNLLNALAAAGVATQFGIDPATVAQGLESVDSIPGRFEPVHSTKRRVIVDYAHTSQGLESLLTTCRSLLTPGQRLLLVFGCGGDRDRTKRPRMGETATRLADLVVVTNDNPRSEPPEVIIEEILSGVPTSARARLAVEHDRRKAIDMAIRKASPDDLVVIAGKGHEDYQILGDTTVRFDDREVAREVLDTL